MTEPMLLIADPRPGIRLLTLNRPEVRNALSTALLAELAQAIDAAREDSAVRVAIITGGPKVFAAGADIRELAGRDALGALTDQRPRYWERLRKFPKPLLAAVNGYALGGGCELAMHCDIVIAGVGAKFGLPEVNLGIIPGGGGTQRLARIAGQQAAMKLCLSGEFIDATEAKTCGLVAEIVPDDTTLTRALTLAESIAAKAPIAVRLAKEAILASCDLPLEAGLAFERKAFAMLFATEDFREGVAAFLDKRKPKFSDR
jgi:enoyl-CoA hydratase